MGWQSRGKSHGYDGKFINNSIEKDYKKKKRASNHHGSPRLLKSLKMI